MAKRHIIVITCEDLKSHPNRQVTVAAFRNTVGQFWTEITPREVRKQYADGKRSIPVLDALRHVREDANQQILSEDRLPWGPNLDKMLANPEQQTVDRLRLDCPLCRKRQMKDPVTGEMVTRPNTLVMGPRFREVFDRFAEANESVVTIDLLRNAYKLL